MEENEYTLEISQVIIKRLMKRNGKPVGAAETLIRPCCPARFHTAFGVSEEELAVIMDEDEQIREFVWPTDEEELNAGSELGPGNRS